MTHNELQRLLDNTIEIAHESGALISESPISPQDILKKSRIDLVTRIDLAVNQVLCRKLARLKRNVDIIAEEGVDSTLKNARSRFSWVIDPIDGTTNFVHGLNHSAISVALFDRTAQRPVLAVVYDPFRAETFCTYGQSQTKLNGTIIEVSQTRKLEDSVIATGFSYDRKTNPDNNLSEFSAVMPLVQGIRRFGAASLDLAYVAAGRLDAYFEGRLKFWDYAAGILLVENARGRVCQYDGSTTSPESGHLVAGNPYIIETLLGTIQDARHNSGLAVLPTRTIIN